MAKRTTLLFDLDGTLINSVDLIVDSYLHTFASHGLPPVTREEIIDGIGTPLVAVFGRLTDRSDEINRWIETYREFNLAHHDTRVHAFPGVTDMLLRLHQSGRRLGIVTSKNNAGARRGLRLIGVEHLVSVIVGADDVSNHKPHPEPVERALSGLAAPATDACFVGDSHHDIASGNAAGVATVAVTWGPISRERLAAANPHHIVDTIDELALLLDQG